MTRYTTYETVTLYTMTCGKCGITFSVPDYWRNERLDKGDTFYCPNGDPRVFREKEADRLRRQLESARARATAERDQRKAAERSLAATKGHLTRTKRRAVAGACQHCQRTFSNVAEHMRKQHPDLVAEHQLNRHATETPPPARSSVNRAIDATVLAELVNAGGVIVAEDGSASTQLIDAVVAAVGCGRREVSNRLSLLESGGHIQRDAPDAGGRWVYRIELVDA